MNPSPMHSFFASELRRAREAEGLTQQALAHKLQYSTSLVALVEQGRRFPGDDFTRRLDEVLPTDGLLERIRRKLLEESLVAWFRAWSSFEQQAIQLRNYECNLVPGLLQTREYARALYACSTRLPASELEKQLTARMERQEILTRAEPPQFYAVMDDHVLRRPIGSREVMHGQLMHLIEMGELPHIHLHVIPADAGAYEGLDGSFVIATMPDGEEVGFMDHQLEGQVIQRPRDVLALRRTWDAVRSEALPHRQTMDVITEAAKSWS